MKHTEYLEYEFTDTEIAEMARQLARANRTKASLEQQKKEVDSQLKADIEVQNSAINKMSQGITVGREWRTIECLVILDTPEPGKKTIRRNDTGSDVKVIPMTDEDRQMVLDLTAKADAADADKPKAPHPMPGAPQAQLLPATPATPATDALRESIAKGTITICGPLADELAEAWEHEDSAPLAPAAVMGGTHQRKARAPRDPQREAVADGTAEE